jgi:hypothetical protein
VYATGLQGSPLSYPGTELDLDGRARISNLRLYTDEEVSAILQEAAQSTNTPAGTRTSSTGLSLEQIKEAAAEAGLDPSLVERAALRLTQRSPESLLERAAGGPLRHRETVYLPTRMNKQASTRLLSAIRAAAEVPGQGSADESGFSWHGWYRGNRLTVTAHEDSQGTRVQVLLDRGASRFQTVFWSTFAIVMPIWAMIESIDSIPEMLTLAAIPIGVLAAARAYWKSSTRSLRERIALLLDAARESPPTDDDSSSR